MHLNAYFVFDIIDVFFYIFFHKIVQNSLLFISFLEIVTLYKKMQNVLFNIWKTAIIQDGLAILYNINLENL